MDYCREMFCGWGWYRLKCMRYRGKTLPKHKHIYNKIARTRYKRQLKYYICTEL